MITHADLGTTGFAQIKLLRALLNSGQISMAGNRKLKIYGRMECASGKRMKTGNRVFFKDKQEALQNGYRPCGHCLQQAYQQWKAAGSAM